MDSGFPKRTCSNQRHYSQKLGIQPGFCIFVAGVDLTDNVVREAALPLGLVDVKDCAVDATWSGLKFVIRRKLRP